MQRKRTALASLCIPVWLPKASLEIRREVSFFVPIAEWQKPKISLSDFRSNGKYMVERQHALLANRETGGAFNIRRGIKGTGKEMKRILLVAVSLFALAGFCDEAETIKVRGKGDRKSTRLNSSHRCTSRMPSSA